MSYCQFKPHPDLLPYIDAYWVVEGHQAQYIQSNILPDGCIDLILNLKDDYRAKTGELAMAAGKAYLVGTMTTYKTSFISPDNKLVGIRFKPAGFSTFYRFASLSEITDATIEFDAALSPDLHKTAQHFLAYLNRFFLQRLQPPKHALAAIIQDVERSKGQVAISALAARNHITTRQLERNFQRYIGVSPKEFTNIVRFRSALSQIKYNTQQDSLLAIALNCGYYDHAHLTNDIKKYAGAAPSVI
ncbi:AraC family transcriptional regulator [Chitinophaga pinensis]|uniref:Transcriptional regulator, AraC family n=1 Tax=Chitinophaga pinensis (strain ATCC 43595 / DSM 2588 / LMG 13176 / NBRC 15968 / NCIMB 11800 / UQM 2034) TaxID=485918 RepID=A0A979G118_CHIPD|nr:helix-turn-helix domain-containing protein [Chitinophaga pinensis]ACU58808.1 transcriptional regulator, AraC family [Chitinophaga pinensis DSM 2588]